MCCVTLANRRFPTGRRLALCPTASFGKLGRAIEAASQLTAGLGRCITSKTDNKSTSDPCAYEAPFRVTLLPDWPFITYRVDGQNLLAGLHRLSKHIRRVLKQENVSGVHLKLRKDMILWTYLYKNYVWLFCLIGFTRRWDVCHKMFDVLRSQSKLFPPPSSLPFLKADIKLKDQRIKPLKKNLFIYFFPLIFPWPLHLLLVNWTLFLRFIAIALYCPCASQQRIDEIYDFLAENASRLPIGPLPKFHPTRPFDQSVTKEADEGAHGPGNQAQLEMKICSKWRSVKIFSTLAWQSELPPKVEFVFHPSFLQ